MLSAANLRQAQLDRLQAGSGLAEAQELLANVLGVEPQTIGTADGAVPVSLPPMNVDVHALAAATPDFAQAAAREEQSRSGITVARSALLPTLNLTAAAGKLDSFYFPRNDRWQVGLALTIPLFSGGHDYYGLQAAHANMFAASAARESTDRALVSRVQQAYDAYTIAVEKELVDRSYLDAAKTRADIGRGKYNNGLLSFEEWDLIENDLIVREKAALTSGRDRITAEANFEVAIGRGALP
jgi:outer membrane protein